MKRTITALATILLMLPLAAMAQGGPACDGTGPGPMGKGMGQGMGHGMGPGMGCRSMKHDGFGMQRGGGMAIAGLLRNAEEIGLTDQQQADLKKMAETFQMDRIDREAALDKAQVKMRSLMMDDKAAESQVLAQIDQVSKLKADLQKMRYQHRKQVQNLLTDDQQAKLKELRKARWQDRFDGDDDMPGPGMGRGMGRGQRP